MATPDTVNFKESGILAHSTSGDKYNGSLTLNDAAITNNNSSSQ